MTVDGLLFLHSATIAVDRAMVFEMLKSQGLTLQKPLVRMNLLYDKLTIFFLPHKPYRGVRLAHFTRKNYAYAASRHLNREEKTTVLQSIYANVFVLFKNLS